jgi:hypothetical protein
VHLVYLCYIIISQCTVQQNCNVIAFSRRALFSLCQEHALENRGLVYKCPWFICEVRHETLQIFSWLWIKVGEELQNILFNVVVLPGAVLSSTQIHVVCIPRR